LIFLCSGMIRPYGTAIPEAENGYKF
jgi:hypothetical protein